MRQLTIVLFFLLPLLTTAKSFELPSDTIIYHKNKKIIIYKYKSKANYRRKQGHRQPYTKVSIEKIEA